MVFQAKLVFLRGIQFRVALTFSFIGYSKLTVINCYAIHVWCIQERAKKFHFISIAH